MSKNISIYDIAKYINVSPATVSYVINGVNKVSDKTRKAVLEAIDELGYVIDHNARSLSTGKSHLIGLYLPLDYTSKTFLQNPFYVEFIGGLQLGIKDKDYDIVIGSYNNLMDINAWAKSRKLDGIIILGNYSETVYKNLKDLDIPIVLTDIYETYSSEFNNVRVDDEKGMYLATKHLIENNHKLIGFVGYNTSSLVDMARFNGYKKAMDENNLNVDFNYVYPCYATFESGYEVGEKLLNQSNVTAVVCVADTIAISIIKKFSENNKVIPDDLSIVGFDDIQMSKYVYPSLTTIKQDINEKGRRASEIIINCLVNNSNNNLIVNIDPILIERESVKKI